MKRVGLLFLFLAIVFTGFSQSDTLYTKARTKIPCKIIEINESEFKYKTPDNLDGPVYVIAASKIFRYSLANGQVVNVNADELLIENQHSDIMNKRTAIKIHPFSYVNNQISLAYEHVIKMGTNLDVEMGYINNSIMKSTAGTQFHTTNGNPAPMTGLYIKPGFKFMMGQDFSLKGMKYAHPMKGRFILINAVVSYLNFQDATWYETTSSSTNYLTGNISAAAYGAMINYGRQFILGNVITLEYYIGVGATAQSWSSEIKSNTVVSYNYGFGASDDQAKEIQNYHGFFRAPYVGLSYTFGFRLGFLLADKNRAGKPAGVSTNGSGK